MATNDYVFITQWQVRGSIARAYDLLINIDGYTRSWQGNLDAGAGGRGSGDHFRLAATGGEAFAASALIHFQTVVSMEPSLGNGPGSGRVATGTLKFVAAGADRRISCFPS